jgi:hypothetical protein
MKGARGWWRYVLAFLWVPAMLVPSGQVAAANPNEREVAPQKNVLDKSGIWVLHFRFLDPRLITVDIPGRGRKICWYMRYQVINMDPDQSHTFIPDFELVTLDRNNKVYHDQILPKVQEAISKIEDPTGYLKIKNSVTIASEPIPPTRKDAVPKPVTGVAIWDDVDPESNRYSIFVSGLSNGWAVTDPVGDDGQEVVRRKTLQLNFKRLGDKYFMDAREIRFEGPAEWIYRASKLGVPAKPAAPKKEEKKEGKEAPKTGALPTGNSLGVGLGTPVYPPREPKR